MAKSALRNLSKILPTPDEVEVIMDALQHEKDHSVAIVASSILDAGLETLIREKIKVQRPKVLEQFFAERGVISDFYSRIVVAQAFGIITTPIADELHAIRAVRNVFAHAKISVSFDSKEIANEVKSTDMVALLTTLKDGPKIELSNKAWFLLAVRIMLIVFKILKDSNKTAYDAI